MSRSWRAKRAAQLAGSKVNRFLVLLSLSFGGVKATNISFDVREHRCGAPSSANGAGKSSMLNASTRLHAAAGSITFRGQTSAAMDSRQVRDGHRRTFRTCALFRGMSVIDNIMTGRNLRSQQPVPAGAAHRPRARRRPPPQFVEHIIDFSRSPAYRKTPVDKLPYGLQKRVDLGRALAVEPQVLLLDEPWPA